MDEIEQHLSSCDSCCQAIREQPDDSLVAKLRGRNAATVAESVTEKIPRAEPPSGFQVPSSFVVGPADNAAVHDQATNAGPLADPPALAGLPTELNDHPRYRVVAALGAGGMGTVYRAEHRLMDRPVALKVIRGDLLGNAALVERFRREVKAAARLASHPNIVAAYDAEQAGETHMLVMEFIEGTDLARLVDRRGPLPVGEACEYARQAALGLQHAFEDGMVHRDIKPQNLMRTTRGQIKILDFGLARFASEVGDPRRADRRGHGPGHGRLHRPRADRRPARRRHPGRHLQPRLHALFPAGRPAAVPRWQPDPEAAGPPGEDAAAAGRDSSRRAAGAGPGRRADDGQGPVASPVQSRGGRPGARPICRRFRERRPSTLDLPERQLGSQGRNQIRPRTDRRRAAAFRFGPGLRNVPTPARLCSRG